MQTPQALGFVIVTLHDEQSWLAVATANSGETLIEARLSEAPDFYDDVVDALAVLLREHGLDYLPPIEQTRPGEYRARIVRA